MAKPKKYTWKERENIIKRTLPPEKISIQSLSDEIGLSPATLYRWRQKLSGNKINQQPNNKGAKNWSSEDKFHTVIETYALSEADLAAYCRQKGLYVEQIHSWRKQCLQANKASNPKNISKIQSDLAEEKNRSNELAKELRRKEKALAETAALLVLRKKAQAIWGEEGED